MNNQTNAFLAQCLPEQTNEHVVIYAVYWGTRVFLVDGDKVLDEFGRPSELAKEMKQRCSAEKIAYAKVPKQRDSQSFYSQEFLKKIRIGCVVAWDCESGKTIVYDFKSLDRFQELASRAETIVGFGTMLNDDRLLATKGCNVRTTYDLCYEGRRATRTPLMGNDWGDTMNDYAEVNLGVSMIMHHEQFVPLWERKVSESDGIGRKNDVEFGRQIALDYAITRVEALRDLYFMRQSLLYPGMTDLGTGRHRRISLSLAPSVTSEEVESVFSGKRPKSYFGMLG